jgi:hypothetical protein
MPIPTNKESLQSAISKQYNQLVKELSEIPIELTTVKELDGHAKNTLMSINNLVAYLVGWGYSVYKWAVTEGGTGPSFWWRQKNSDII